MINFESVTKKFKNGHVALHQVTFKIDPGEFIFLLGPSGSGKTTLLRLLLREILPSSGNIAIADQDLIKIPKKAIPKLRRQIGAAFQDFKLLLDRSAYENVALVLDIMGKTETEIKQRTQELLEQVGLKDKMHLFPSQLSGGEIQRVAIARAIASDPVLLFADEPTGNLDKETGTQIVNLLKTINESGTAVIMATHDPSYLTAFDCREIYLNNGVLEKDIKHHRSHKNAQS
jgi:cell division transport system ATP-binding protein